MFKLPCESCLVFPICKQRVYQKYDIINVDPEMDDINLVMDIISSDLFHNCSILKKLDGKVEIDPLLDKIISLYDIRKYINYEEI
jgi:hypothetical protein